MKTINTNLPFSYSIVYVVSPLRLSGVYWYCIYIDSGRSRSIPLQTAQQLAQPTSFLSLFDSTACTHLLELHAVTQEQAVSMQRS